MKTNSVGHILHENCLLKYVNGKTMNKTSAATAWSSGKERVLEIERGSTRSHSMENLLWKGLRICRKIDYGPMMSHS